MHNLKLLAENDSIFSFNKRCMVVIYSLLLRQSFVSGTYCFLWRNSFKRCVVILVLVTPEFTDKASIFSLFSQAFPTLFINLFHLLIGHSLRNLCRSSFSKHLDKWLLILFSIIYRCLLKYIDDPFEVWWWNI